MPSIFIKSERLLYRPANIKDAAFIFRLLNEPDWIKYIGDRNVHSLEQSELYIKEKLQDPALHSGLGMYVIETKGDGSAIGLCGLLQRDYMTGIDIGYALLPEARGFGYAREAVNLFIKHAFQDLSHTALYAIIQSNNVSSLNLIKSCGFKETPQPFKGDSQEDDLLYFVRNA